MRRASKILIVTLLLLILTLALASCKKNVEISVKEEAAPQSVFVLGEELDLSSGILVVDEGGNKTEIPMNAEGVSVSGYDKNTLGEQKITVTYKDKSLELTVTVVERMQVSDHTKDYLVDDTLNLSAGRFKITRNDGSNYTISFKDTKLTFAGFDSSTAGTKTVTATYKTGSETYTTSFNVNVHNVQEVTLKSPTKVAYNSHDSGVDVSGGILTLSALDGKIKREVPVTIDMIKGGFNLKEANETNSPKKQNVEVHYEGEIYTYEILITYTSVSKFKDNAALVSEYEWAGDEEFEIPENVGEKALELMELYFDMSPAEQSLLTRNETLNMARAAMIYGFTKWYNDLSEFDGAFGLDDYGQFELVCRDEESIASALEKLEDTDRPIYTLYDVLNSMSTTFKDEILFTFTGDEPGEAYFSYYVVVNPELYTELVGVFEYMLELDALMDEVGSDWKTVGVEAYSSEIEAVYNSIVNGEYYSYDYAQFFFYVSLWREEADAFNYLYEYYYDVKEDVDAIIALSNVRLPSELEEIFAHIFEAMNQIEYIGNYMVADTTQFFYHYHKAAALSEALLGADLDPDDSYGMMLKVLFYGLPLNGMLGIDTSEGVYTFNDMIAYLSEAQGGYYALCGALLDLPAFDALMDKYMSIITNIFEVENYEGSAEYIAAVKEMFSLYMALTPAQQFTFLGTLNAYYSMSIPPIAFENDSAYADLISVFVDMVNEVYMGMFEGQDGKDAYINLIIATELYTQRYTNNNWFDGSDQIVGFKDRMSAVAAAITAMTNAGSADLALFNSTFGSIYAEYKAILDSYNEVEDGEGDETIDFGEWQDDFEELQYAVMGVELSYMLMDNGYNMYTLFFSAFERAQAIYNRILAAPAEIRNLLIYENLYSTSSLDKFLDPDADISPEDEIFWSFDYIMCVYRSVYTNAQLTLAGGQSIYDMYKGFGMSQFMDKVYDVVWALMWSDTQSDDNFNKEKVIDVMKSFCQMDVEAQMLFVVYLESDVGMYYEAIAEFLAEENYSENVNEAVTLLIAVEMDAIVYNYYCTLYENDDITAEDLATALADLNASYAAFEEVYNVIKTVPAELAEFDDFKEIYEYYKSIVDAANDAVAA